MENRTTIQIENKTLLRIKEMRIYKRETYDEIINRIVDQEQKNKKKTEKIEIE